MFIDFLTERFREHAAQDAMVWRENAYTYGWFLREIPIAQEWLKKNAIPEGSVVSLEADFSPRTVAMLLALIDNACILVPLTSTIEAKKPDFLQIGEVEHRVIISLDDATTCAATGTSAAHPILRDLKHKRRPGLVLFSSGSTGKSKAAVHDLLGILKKFQMRRQAKRMISFLLFDHIGGFNTLMHCLSNGGCLITTTERSPDGVCDIIERHRAQILPTSPSFLRLLLISQTYKRHNLSSLETISYGTEPMPETTLRAIHEVFPDVTLQQTYGLSEIGIMRSKSRSSDSLWVKVGGEGFQTRIVGGLLEVKAESAMLGYLNAPSPFTEDGWFRTGDAVEVDGEYLRILGRRSELINVGGEKVYPAEVESVLLEAENVADVTVHGEQNPILGSVVVARVNLVHPEDPAHLRQRLRAFCRQRLAPYKVPARIEIVEGSQHGGRYKKLRGNHSPVDPRSDA